MMDVSHGAAKSVAPAESEASRERRRSNRWCTDAPLTWRVERGRRPRPGRVLERSLEGMILAVDVDDLPAVGKRLKPHEPLQGTRLGFSSAIVTRTGHGDGRLRLVYLEIEA